MVNWILIQGFSNLEAFKSSSMNEEGGGKRWIVLIHVKDKPLLWFLKGALLFLPTEQVNAVQESLSTFYHK